MVIAHMDCINTIHDVLSGHDNGNLDDNDNGNLDDNDKIHDEGKNAEAQVVDENVQQTTNVAMEPPAS
jgi:hypothetical protein